MSKRVETQPSGRVLLTPEVAKHLLERNTKNRSLRWRYVLTLASVMQRGEWVFNGDSIEFDTNGVLTNGQHRLAACVESGVPIEVNIVWGVPSQSYVTRDRGLSRQYSDTLHVIGKNNCTARAAIVSAIYTYEHSNPRGKVHYGERPSICQLEEYRTLHPNTDSFLDTSWATPTRKCGVNVTYAGLLWYAFERTGFQDKADDFFSVLCGETEATRYHPARMLPERFMQAKLARHSLRLGDAVSYCVRSFNAFLEGKTSLQKLYGDVSEVSPSFNGWPRGLCHNKNGGA